MGCDTTLIPPVLVHENDCSLVHTCLLRPAFYVLSVSVSVWRPLLPGNVLQGRAGPDVNGTCEIPCLASKLGAGDNKGPQESNRLSQLRS